MIRFNFLWAKPSSTTKWFLWLGEWSDHWSSTVGWAFVTQSPCDQSRRPPPPPWIVCEPQHGTVCWSLPFSVLCVNLLCHLITMRSSAQTSATATAPVVLDNHLGLELHVWFLHHLHSIVSLSNMIRHLLWNFLHWEWILRHKMIKNLWIMCLIFSRREHTVTLWVPNPYKSIEKCWKIFLEN